MGSATDNLDVELEPKLDIEDDSPFHVAEWRVQRWGLAGLAIVVAASVVGLVGSPTTLLRVLAIYGFLLVVFRLAGKRTLAQMNSFDLVLVMVIGDATQQALIGDDFTIGTAIVAISSLILFDVAFGYIKSRWTVFERVMDGLPLVLIDRGTVLDDRMTREGIDLGDILTAAREQHGLRRLNQIDFAVLERSGGLSIIPRERRD